MSTKATTYAQGLVQVALNPWLEQLASVQQALRRNPELAATLSDPNSPPDARERAIKRLLPRQAAPEVVAFVRLMAQRGDLRLLEDVLRRVRTTVPALSEVGNVVITSAHDLSDSEKEKLEAKLRADHGEGISVQYEVDPDLLGGLRIRIGDRVLDHSVAARLDALRARLVR